MLPFSYEQTYVSEQVLANLPPALIDACAESLKIAGCRKVYGLTLFFD